MKLIFIVILSFLFTNLATADSTVVYGKNIKGYIAASDRRVMLWLSGDWAESVYNYMKEESKENMENCIGTIKQFPGFLCSKNKNIFECFIQIDMEKGVLEGDIADLCKSRAGMIKKTPLTAREIFSGDMGMSFHFIGKTAKIMYSQITTKPVYNSPTTCSSGPVKQFKGLECSGYKKKYECDMYITLETGKLESPGMCPE
jgi:hypothetical protein